MADSSILAQGVSYRIAGRNLVADVDLEAKEGEVLVIIGPNGAGKSTLLSLLAGDLIPSIGSVWLGATDTARAAPGELAMVRSVLTQRNPIDIPYTVAQVVAMGRFPHRRDPANSQELDDAAVTDAMRRTDTLALAGRAYRTLSGGERTRVGLARVLAQATPIVLLDEPTTALDVGHGEAVMRETVRLARSGKTAVVVMHDLNAAARHADRIALMHEGRIVAMGDPGTVLQPALLSAVYNQLLVVVEHPIRNGLLVLVAEQGPHAGSELRT